MRLRPRTTADVIDLLLDEGECAVRRVHDGDLILARRGDHERPWLIALAAGADPYRGFGPREQVALCITAARIGAEPALAWWPRRRPVPEWIFHRDWTPMAP